MMAPKQQSNRDVRMRGFLNRVSVQSAINWLDQQLSPCAAVTVPLRAAAGRSLAEDVIAPIDVPAFDRSAMDGYALSAAETQGASDYQPLPFIVCGESMPGKPFAGKLSPGTAVRIMTGAPIPAGADAVVPAEYASQQNNLVEISQSVPSQKHIGKQGEDIRGGSIVLQRGRHLRPQDLGVLASLGIAEVLIIGQPCVRIIMTGNEIVPPGNRKQPFQIYDANSSMLQALISRDGGQTETHTHLPDEREPIREALSSPGADLILVSGGSSVGVEDHAPMLLAELGELAIHGIAMRPSSPTGIGRIGNTIVVLLPGNPVSCLCAYDFFAGRAIRQMGGGPAAWPYVQRECQLKKKIVSAVGRVDYCRVVITQAGFVEPLAISGASLLSSTSRADGFVVVPAECEGYPQGATVTVFLYDVAGSGAK